MKRGNVDNRYRKWNAKCLSMKDIYFKNSILKEGTHTQSW